MIRVEESVHVASDSATTFEFLSRIERYPEWLPGVIAAAQTSEGPIGAGTTFTLRLSGPAGPIDAAGEITALEPGRSVELRADAPVGRVIGGFELLSEADATRIDVRMAVELNGAYRFVEGLVARELKAATPEALEVLKARIEAWEPA